MAAAALAACLVVAFSSANPGAAQPLATPRVINGVGGHPYAAAAVAIETPDSYCTASLLAPRLLITAAHCINGDGGGAAGVAARDIDVFTPGGDRRSGAARVRVSEIVYDPQWTESVDDIAFLVLDSSLGTPIISRLATPAEVATLAAARAVVTYVGYGLTGPREEDSSRVSDVPLAVSQPLTSSYRGGRAVFETRGDGVTGTCGGDSGGPWLVEREGQLLYLGPLSGGSGLPCDEAESPSNTGEEATVAALHTGLISRAMASAGVTSLGSGAGPTPAATPTPTPTTAATPTVTPTPTPAEPPAAAIRRVCLQGPDVKRQCTEGAQWRYAYCWDGTRAVLEHLSDGLWSPVARLRARRSQECSRRYPFEVAFEVTEEQLGQHRYRVVVDGTRDPFRVTVT